MPVRGSAYMHSQQKRRKKGSAITEFGPALFLFIIIIFFPMLDFLGLCAAYCAGWYCNFMACRELSVRKKDEGLNGTVFTEVNGNLFTSGLVHFIGIKTEADLVHTASYPDPATTGQQPEVVCTTNIKATPFITIPFWGNVPGLNAPMDFVIVSSRPREVTQ